ncbi:urea amidolyase-like protein [Microbacterium sp. HM58-2]|nr:urea amidolyase-like protein [Microbacterium sp. HM58-2]
MRILTASDRALLVEAADLDEAMRIHLGAAGLRGVVERVPGARTVLVRFDPLQVSAQELTELLRGIPADAVLPVPSRAVTIPVRYDGEDLAAVADLLGVTAEEVVARHLAAEWRVAFSGFAPGFGYLVGSDALFDVPRRSSPRTRVPAGSVGLAGPFSGVYPRESPGGWQLIGRTDAVMWDVDRDPPALLSPGTAVRFARAERDGPPIVAPSLAARASAHDRGEASDAAIEVVHPGLQLLVQDRGRPGHAALGVSASGAADRTALGDANRAVGNGRGAAVLENVGGAVLRVRGSAVLAVAGAVGDLIVTDAAGDERPAPHGAPFGMSSGDALHLEPPVRGLRYVVGVRGGIRGELALGSRATDTLAGLGPAPLAAGDVVGIGDGAPHAVEPDAVPRTLPASGDLVDLEITLGPRADWFTEGAVHALIEQEWEVTPRSDRVGIRLRGPVPLERAITGELPSEGAVTGAIQVPPDGQPVLFLADHPLTGGYPIVGALTDRCLDLAAQLPPGARIRFRVAPSSSRSADAAGTGSSLG